MPLQRCPTCGVPHGSSQEAHSPECKINEWGAAHDQAVRAATNKERLYHLDVRKVRVLPGGKYVEAEGYVRITSYPMTHRECETMKSKHNPEVQSRMLFVEATDG